METILGTTRPQPLREPHAREALLQLAAHVNAGCDVVGRDHDPRIPPHGRLRCASLREDADGYFSAVGTIELFEPGDAIEPVDPREIELHTFGGRPFGVAYNAPFDNAEDLVLIAAAASVLGVVPEDRAGTLDARLAILRIGAALEQEAIGGGFAAAQGAVVQRRLAAALKTLFARRRAAEPLLVVELLVQRPGAAFNVEVVLTRPTTDQIAWMLEAGMCRLEAQIARRFDPSHALRKMVFELERGELRYLFGVRKDAVPVGAGC